MSVAGCLADFRMTRSRDADGEEGAWVCSEPEAIRLLSDEVDEERPKDAVDRNCDPGVDGHSSESASDSPSTSSSIPGVERPSSESSGRG